MINNNSNNSLHSPKCRYYGELTTDQPIAGIGNVISYNSDSKEHLISIFKQLHKQKGTLVIRENKATYPSFDWAIVDTIKWGE